MDWLILSTCCGKPGSSPKLLNFGCGQVVLSEPVIHTGKEARGPQVVELASAGLGLGSSSVPCRSLGKTAVLLEACCTVECSCTVMGQVTSQ